MVWLQGWCLWSWWAMEEFKYYPGSGWRRGYGIKVMLLPLVRDDGCSVGDERSLTGHLGGWCAASSKCNVVGTDDRDAHASFDHAADNGVTTIPFHSQFGSHVFEEDLRFVAKKAVCGDGKW